MARFAVISLLWLLAPALAVPKFNVDLDLPAEERWVEVAKHYKVELAAMSAGLEPIIDKHLGKSKQEWLELSDKLFDPVHLSEMQGMVNAMGPSAKKGEASRKREEMDNLKLLNLLYEVASPTSCSAVLWSSSNGTVYQGRNMDYAFHFKMPDGRTLNWPDVTFEAVFHKNKKPLFIATTWPGLIGVHTGMHYDGWAFQQNTRPGNDQTENLKAAKQGGLPYPSEARKILETTSDWQTAVDKLYSTKFMAPMYFAVSGKGEYEGATLSMDRLGQHLDNTPPIQKLSAESDGSWHLVQTNDDIDKPMPFEPRRPVANAMLEGMTQEIVNEANLMQFMHTEPLHNHLTVFSTVMVPATGYYQTVLPTEAPTLDNGFEAIKAGFGHDPTGLSTDRLQKRELFFKSLGNLTTAFDKDDMLSTMQDLAATQAFMQMEVAKEVAKQPPRLVASKTMKVTKHVPNEVDQGKDQGKDGEKVQEEPKKEADEKEKMASTEASAEQLPIITDLSAVRKNACHGMPALSSILVLAFGSWLSAGFASYM